jgi:hypothetical protein
VGSSPGFVTLPELRERCDDVPNDVIMTIVRDNDLAYRKYGPAGFLFAPEVADAVVERYHAFHRDKMAADGRMKKRKPYQKRSPQPAA